MVDLLEISPGRIIMRDTDGTTVFDTDERLFTATDSKSGSITRGPYTATDNNVSSTPIMFETLHNLGSINAAADIVRGSFKVTTAGQGAVANLGWFNASGTYVHWFGANLGVFTGTYFETGQFAFYTFEASGGVLYLRERVAAYADPSASSSITNSFTLLQLTIQYNLLCGTFV